MSGDTPCFALTSLCDSTACFAHSPGGTEGCVGCIFWEESDEDPVLFATSGSPESMKAF